MRDLKTLKISHEGPIAPSLQSLDVVEQINGAVLTAGKVFHQAHHQAILSVSLDDERRYLELTERLIRFKPIRIDAIFDIEREINGLSSLSRATRSWDSETLLIL
jgi:hypothetical protein